LEVFAVLIIHERNVLNNQEKPDFVVLGVKVYKIEPDRLDFVYCFDDMLCIILG